MDAVLLAFLLSTLALGGVGIYLMMPGGRASSTHFGALLAALGLASLVLLLANRVFGPSAWVFVVLSVVGLYGAVAMITQPKPVYSALYFILVVVSTTGLAWLADAAFVGAAILIIYGGAILVTYVFVIMLSQQSSAAIYDKRARTPFMGVLSGFLLLGVLSVQLLTPSTTAELVAGEPLSLREPVRDTSVLLMTNYMVGVQIIGIVLLAAMVGAIAIARRRADGETQELGEA